MPRPQSSGESSAKGSRASTPMLLNGASPAVPTHSAQAGVGGSGSAGEHQLGDTDGPPFLLCAHIKHALDLDLVHFAHRLLRVSLRLVMDPDAGPEERSVEVLATQARIAAQVAPPAATTPGAATPGAAGKIVTLLDAQTDVVIPAVAVACPPCVSSAGDGGGDGAALASSTRATAAVVSMELVLEQLFHPLHYGAARAESVGGGASATPHYEHPSSQRLAVVPFALDVRRVLEQKVLAMLLPAHCCLISVSFSVSERDVDGYRRRLARFLAAHNRDALRHLDALLGRVSEIDVFTKLRRKYGLVDFAARVREYMKLYRLADEATVDETLHHWEMQEETLIQQLVAFHGPAPEDIPQSLRAFAFMHRYDVDPADPLLCTDAERGVPAAQFAEKMRKLVARFGPEPVPSTYLFPQLTRAPLLHGRPSPPPSHHHHIISRTASPSPQDVHGHTGGLAKWNQRGDSHHEALRAFSAPESSRSVSAEEAGGSAPPAASAAITAVTAADATPLPLPTPAVMQLGAQQRQHPAERDGNASTRPAPPGISAGSSTAGIDRSSSGPPLAALDQQVRTLLPLLPPFAARAACASSGEPQRGSSVATAAVLAASSADELAAACAAAHFEPSTAAALMAEKRRCDVFSATVRTLAGTAADAAMAAAMHREMLSAACVAATQCRLVSTLLIHNELRGRVFEAELRRAHGALFEREGAHRGGETGGGSSGAALVKRLYAAMDVGEALLVPHTGRLGAGTPVLLHDQPWHQPQPHDRRGANTVAEYPWCPSRPSFAEADAASGGASNLRGATGGDGRFILAFVVCDVVVGGDDSAAVTSGPPPPAHERRLTEEGLELSAAVRSVPEVIRCHAGTPHEALAVYAPTRVLPTAVLICEVDLHSRDALARTCVLHPGSPTVCASSAEISALTVTLRESAGPAGRKALELCDTSCAECLVRSHVELSESLGNTVTSIAHPATSRESPAPRSEASPDPREIQSRHPTSSDQRLERWRASRRIGGDRDRSHFFSRTTDNPSASATRAVEMVAREETPAAAGSRGPSHQGGPGALVREGWRLFRMGQRDAAVARMLAAHTDFPDSAEGLEARGIVAELADKDAAAAVEWYTAALRLDPCAVGALCRCAHLLEARMGRHNEALQLYDAAHRLGDAAAGHRADLLRRGNTTLAGASTIAFHSGAASAIRGGDARDVGGGGVASPASRSSRRGLLTRPAPVYGGVRF